MEYEVRIKNVFNRDTVIEQIKGGRGLLDFLAVPAYTGRTCLALTAHSRRLY